MNLHNACYRTKPKSEPENDNSFVLRDAELRVPIRLTNTGIVALIIVAAAIAELIWFR